MKNIKVLILLIFVSFLSACMQPVALLGPAITIGTTGNIYQAGFSYGSNKAIENKTGKTTIEHFSNLFNKKKSGIINPNIIELVEK